MEYIADTFYNEPEKQANWYTPAGLLTEEEKNEINLPGKSSINYENMDKNSPPTIQYDKGMKSLQNMIDIQSQSGNWNWDPYMQGLMNGLLLAKSCFEHHTVVLLQLKSAPDKWVSPNEINYETDSLKDQIQKVIDRYRDDHMSDIASQVGLQETPYYTPYYAECDAQKESCDTCFKPFDYTATNSVSAEI